MVFIYLFIYFIFSLSSHSDCESAVVGSAARMPLIPLVPENHNNVLAEFDCLDPLLSALRFDSGRLKVESAIKSSNTKHVEYVLNAVMVVTVELMYVTIN